MLRKFGNLAFLISFWWPSLALFAVCPGTMVRSARFRVCAGQFMSKVIFRSLYVFRPFIRVVFTNVDMTLEMITTHQSALFCMNIGTTSVSLLVAPNFNIFLFE